MICCASALRRQKQSRKPFAANALQCGSRGASETSNAHLPLVKSSATPTLPRLFLRGHHRCCIALVREILNRLHFFIFKENPGDRTFAR